MTIPSVNATIKDGGLGIQSPALGDLPCVIGACTSGTAATPTMITTVTDLVATFGTNETTELAAQIISRTGKPVLMVATGITTEGTHGTIDHSHVTGTSDPTATVAATPNDRYEVKVVVTTGGTRGTAGIKYKMSFDNGRTYGPIQSLGTATVIADSTTGVSFDIGAGTLVAGDYFTCVTTAPVWNTTQLGAAFTSLLTTTHPFTTIVVVGDVDGTSFDTISTSIEAAWTAGTRKPVLCAFRVPQVSGETDAQYQTAFDTAFGSKSSKFIEVCAGSAYVTSALSFRQYVRPVNHAVAGRWFSVSLGKDAAEVAIGPISGVSLHDSAKLLQHHDERTSSGLDDMRAVTLRTHRGLSGVYVTNPRVLAAGGSDFIYHQFVRVMATAIDTAEAVLVQRLNSSVRVDTTTGFIDEADAQAIETVVTQALRNSLMSIPSVSGVTFVLSRTDNILSSSHVHGTVSIIPLGYLKQITVEYSFNNPAIRVTA